MTDTLYKIKVMQAWEDGTSIRYSDGLPLGKKEDGCTPGWDWTGYDYEIAPDTVYANIYPDSSKTLHHTIEKAKSSAGATVIRVAVKYEEVIE